MASTRKNQQVTQPVSKETNLEAIESEETLPDNETDVEESDTEDELELTKKVYYLNSKPIGCTPELEKLPLIHWTAIKEGTLNHTSEQLHTVKDDRKILSPFYDCRFISLMKTKFGEEGKEYVQVQVDRDFVLNRVATLLSFYADKEDDIVALVDESLTVVERIKQKKIEQQLKELAEKNGIDIESLKAMLAKQ